MNYIKYLQTLNYPEYSHKSTYSKKLSKKNNGSIDLELLDLSLSQKEIIDRKLITIIKNALVDVGKYSFTQNERLIEDLSIYHKIPTNEIAITAGCDGALRILSRLLINQTSRICIPLPSFGRYEYHTKINFGKIFFIKPNKFPYDLNIKQITKYCNERKIDLLFLANPNNPTGIYKDKRELLYLFENYKGYILLDESLIYPTLDSSASLVGKYKNLIILKSFSKFYGVAGARIGYIIADKTIIEVAKKLISPFEVSSIALSLAIAIFEDKEYLVKEKNLLDNSIKLINYFKSSKILVGNTSSSTAVIKSLLEENLYKRLLSEGIKTVDCKDFRGLELENCVRVSIKDTTSIKKLISTLNKISLMDT